MEQSKISPLAVVSPMAKIGKNVIIHPFAVVEQGTEIGDETEIMSGAQVLYGSVIGKNCKIHSYAVVGGEPQDLKYEGEDSKAIIGDYTIIREFATINRGTKSKGKTVIGSHCLIMAYAHIAHDCILKDRIIIGNSCQIAGEVEIDDYAIVSAASLVHQFVRISQHVMIQGGCRLTKDIPPYILVGRDPAVYCGINIVGLRRRGFSNEQIFQINDVYRTLYQRGLNHTQAITAIAEEIPDSYERNLIVNFIRNSERGIIRGNMD